MTTSQYSIAIPERQSGVVRLAASGELDFAAREDLDAALRDAVAHASSGWEICVDLDKVTYIDSTAIGVLARAAAAARKSGAAMYVINSHGLVREVLTITGVLERLQPPAGHR